MPAVVVIDVVKSYKEKVAVDGLSFSVEKGEIFGLIGPNGAGKTTTIRMIMDIIQPDAGLVTVFGEISSEATKGRLGYLPEERGLYKKLSVIETISYLASLKGTDPRTIESETEALLEQTGMLAHKKKKVEELSKGMSQIIQLIVTIVHDPELVILDEPFTGLDPVNTERVKQLLLDLRDRGKAVILSTHQMNQVEAVSDRILMVNDGRAVLYGELADIRTEHRGHAVLVESDIEVPLVAGVIERRVHKDHTELVLDTAATPQQALEELVKAGVPIERFEVYTPSLHEIFLQTVGGDADAK
ncbi:ABC transporter ATP-binding protein [Candidatus Bipolaricaulota bacterium]